MKSKIMTSLKIAVLILIVVTCIYLFVRPSGVKSVVYNHPRAVGWAALSAALLIGAVLSLVVVYIARRRLFGDVASKELQYKNLELSRENSRLIKSNEDLEEENVKLRACWHQATIKATAGVGTILSAFGMEEK